MDLVRADAQQIFDFMVRDFLQRYGKSSTTPEQMNYCSNRIRKPSVDHARYDRVWRDVLALNGAYEMNP